VYIARRRNSLAGDLESLADRAPMQLRAPAPTHLRQISRFKRRQWFSSIATKRDRLICITYG
jgi:hypothetical protein